MEEKVGMKRRTWSVPSDELALGQSSFGKGDQERTR